MKPPIAWIPLALVLTGALAFLCANFSRSAMESKIASRTEAELLNAGVGGIQVEAEAGRDVILRGTLPSEELTRRAETIAESVRGVRRVHNRLDLDTVANLGQTVRLARRGNSTTLSGVVPDTSTRQDVVQIAQELFGVDAVRDELSVSANTSAPWLNAFEDIAQTYLTDIEDGTFELDADRILLEGTVETERLKESIGGQITELFPTQEIDNRLRVRPQSAAELEIRELLALKNIEFQTNSDQLTPTGRRTLDEVIVVLTKLPNAEIEISGHTDSTGEPAYNLALSQLRADAVRHYLGRVVNVEAYSTVGYGAERPVADNASAQGRQRNRRIEFRILREN